MTKPVLDYPIPPPEEFGTTTAVADGVLWLRMPLPFALDHVNVWALEDGDGWALVDTGIRTETTLAIWRKIFHDTDDKRPIRRIFATHMHPDHIGLAGWLSRKFGSTLWMSRAEYLTGRVLVSDTGKEAPAAAIAFYRQAGWSESALETYYARFGNFGKFVYPMPDSYRRVVDGEMIRIGTQDWEVIIGTGHSPEHVCLYCPALKVLIAGDQVLPKISSNVSVHPTEPESDPMRGWLDSLDTLKHRVPDDVLVLPAHHDCFRGLHRRLDYLAITQRQSLARLHQAIAQPRRVVDVFGTLFARAIPEQDPALLGLATGEAIACLNHLLRRELATRTLDRNGVAWFQSQGDARVLLQR